MSTFFIYVVLFVSCLRDLFLSWGHKIFYIFFKRFLSLFLTYNYKFGVFFKGPLFSSITYETVHSFPVINNAISGMIQISPNVWFVSRLFLVCSNGLLRMPTYTLRCQKYYGSIISFNNWYGKCPHPKLFFRMSLFFGLWVPIYT